MPGHTEIAAPVLAGAVVLIALSLLAFAKTFASSSNVSWMLAGAALILPLMIASAANLTRRAELTDWLWGSFCLASLLSGLYFAPTLPQVPEAVLWGLGATLALAIAALFHSRISLIVCGLVSLVWIWNAYSSDPPVDFLWPFLLVFSVGISLCNRQPNPLAAIGFALGLVLWSGLTMQAAIVLRAAGSTQITLIGSLFLLVSALLVHAAQPKPARRLQWPTLILVISSALVASYAISPLASIAEFSQSPVNRYLWLLATSTLLGLGVSMIVLSTPRRIDQFGLAAALVLLALGIFVLPAITLPIWWRGAAAGILSLAAIWLAARGFAAADRRAGIAGLGIWGGSVLLTTYGIELPWVRALVLALYSSVAVGFYLAAERQNRSRPNRTQSRQKKKSSDS